MYISGNIGNYAGRIHKLPTGISDISSFALEANNMYISSVALSIYNKWEKELRKKKYNLTHNPTYLTSQILNTWGDEYDGKLVYTRQGIAEPIVVDGPVGAYNLTFGVNKVTEIHCHNCPLITGITCTSNALLTVLDIENLPAIANLRFSGCTALTSINLDTFTSVSGDIDFLNCSSLTSFTAPNLVSVGANFFLTATTITSLSLPSLTSVNSMSCGSISTLISVSLPLLQNAADYIYFAFNTSITSISLPSLISCGTIYTNDMAQLLTISLPSLVSVNQIISYACNLLQSIFVPVLEFITTNLDMASCSNIISIDMPSFSGDLPALLVATDCFSLVTFSASTMTSIDGASMSFYGCSLYQSSVNALIDSVNNGFNISTTLDLSGATNSPPDAGHIALAITLNGFGNSITYNT